MTLTAAFTGTAVAFDRSMQAVEKLLVQHGIRESRFTHLRPERAPVDSRDASDETLGRVVYEFVWPGTELKERRAVRVTVPYQPRIGPQGGKSGSTQEMAGRAMYWFLKAKFDAIDYGIEEFDVAFMPHLVTAIGRTAAEEPRLIGAVVDRPGENIHLGLPEPKMMLLEAGVP